MEHSTEPMQTESIEGQCEPSIQVAGQELTLFVESPAMIAALASDIAGAQRRVWIEVYILANDAGGQRIANLLAEKARAGLDVRLLYDAVGSQATPSSFFTPLIEAGVQIHDYHSFWFALRRLSPLKILNRRDHRKLFIVDDKISYFGGMNLTDTLNAGPGTRATADDGGGWRDLHVRMVGEQTADVAESFERSWRRANQLPVQRRPRAYRRGHFPKPKS